MNKIALVLSCLFFGTLIFNACTDETVEPPLVDCSTLENTYNGEVSSILNTSCNNCHTANSSAAPFALDSYSEYEVYLDNGVFFDEVLEVGGRMAAWGGMTEEEIEIVRCWYDQGYPEN